MDEQEIQRRADVYNETKHFLDEAEEKLKAVYDLIDDCVDKGGKDLTMGSIRLDVLTKALNYTPKVLR